MPSKVKGGNADKHLADTRFPRVSMIDAATGGGGSAPFDPSSVAGYSRDWNFADATKLYTDIAHTTLVSADADPIGAVLCSAGSGVYLVPEADSVRFSYKVNIQNSLSVGRADGTDDRLNGTITADASQTVFLVAKKRGAVGVTNATYWFMGASAQMFTASGSSAVVNYYDGDGGVKVLAGTPTSWNIIVVKFVSNASAIAYINGGAGIAFDPNDAFSSSTIFYLGNDTAYSQPGDFDYGRAMIYSAALSNADLDYVIGGLGTAWNITTTAVS